MSKALNVQDRGGFFDDPFFSESWSDFDSAVQRVLDRFDAPAIDRHNDGGRRAESAEAYRSLRSSRGVEEDIYASQALQVTERDGRFQVVMDVRDFNPRNLQVRAVEDNRIVVEGKYQQVSPDGVSSAWKTFSKEFTLPDEADIDLVTTALSKDGVLTIRAPRKAADVPASGPKPKSSTVQSINESYNEQRTPEGVATKSLKSTSSSTASSFKTTGGKGIQSSSSFESCDSGLDSLPRDIRDRLMVNESGLSSVSSSNSSCSSPVPSEAASDISRVSTTMEFDIGNSVRNNNNVNNSSVQRSEVTFNVGAPGKDGVVRSPTGSSQAPSERVQSPDLESTVSSSSRFSRGSSKLDNYSPPNVMPVFMPSAPRVPTFTAGCGSSGDTNVTIEEKDGKRTVTSERNNTIQEKDGILESREIAAEIDEKDGQSARREAVTRIQRKHDDPDGRFKEAEKAEASDVSESCIKHLPDGSTMSVKKSSTSSSSQKSFSSSGGAIDAFDDPFFSVGFNSDFGDLRSLMGRGHSLMSQMSTDSMASTLSGRSDRSHLSDRSSASTRSNASDKSHFSNRSNASDQSSQSSRSSSAFSDRSRRDSDGSRHHDAVDSMRDRFGFSDRLSTFPERSLFSNRPSLAERFPNFSGALADFDDFPQMDFPEFSSTMGSSFSRSSRNSNNSFSSSFDPFDGKF